MHEHFDVIIVGGGAGGGILAYRLAPSGERVLILDRGDYVPRERENRDTHAVTKLGRYTTKEVWRDADGEPLHPRTTHWVGGNTKFYGAALFRLRREGFGEFRHHGGASPACPVSYDELEPCYTEAGYLYEVRGERGADPTEPPASAPYRFPAVSHEPRIHALHDDLARMGLEPFHVPLGVRLDEPDRRRSPRIRCATCDGHPCLPTVFQKTLALNDVYFGDAEFPFPMGHISFVGKLDAATLAAGAPAIAPKWTLDLLATHSLDFWPTSEDLPDPVNRVTIERNGGIVLAYRPDNEEGHRRLTRRLQSLLRRQTACAVHGHECHEGLFARGLYVGQRIPLAGVAHRNGTVRFGHERRTSALDVNCRAHDVDDLYVVDASLCPSRGAVNPALTVMANALRIADHLLGRLGASAPARAAESARRSPAGVPW